MLWYRNMSGMFLSHAHSLRSLEPSTFLSSLRSLCALCETNLSSRAPVPSLSRVSLAPGEDDPGIRYHAPLAFRIQDEGVDIELGDVRMVGDHR